MNIAPEMGERIMISGSRDTLEVAINLNKLKQTAPIQELFPEKNSWNTQQTKTKEHFAGVVPGDSLYLARCPAHTCLELLQQICDQVLPSFKRNGLKKWDFMDKIPFQGG